VKERGPESQELDRQVERTMRRRAVAFGKWMALDDFKGSEVAGMLGISGRTLGAWTSGWKRDRLKLKPVGRTAYQANDGERQAIVAMLGVVGPGVPLRELQELFPKASRRELSGILEGYRDDWTKQNEKVVTALRWKGTGRVWAMDFTDPPLPVEGKYPKILVIRDLASGFMLLALPSLDATEAAVKDALVALFREVDAPLVLKTDNGSHFTGKESRELLAARGIVHLVSPPGTPRYNGAVEAGIGSLKTRTHLESARQDRPGEWTCDDVEKARLQANDHGRPRGFTGASPAQMWYERERVYDNEREDFQGKVEELRLHGRSERGYFPMITLPQGEEDSIDRVAISRACVALGYLSYRRRRIPLRISDLKRQKVS